MAPKHRTLITKQQIETGIEKIRKLIYSRLDEKGYGTLASSHEVSGLLREEVLEFEKEVHSNSAHGQVRELEDIAVTAIFGSVCIGEGTVDW